MLPGVGLALVCVAAVVQLRRPSGTPAPPSPAAPRPVAASASEREDLPVPLLTPPPIVAATAPPDAPAADLREGPDPVAREIAARLEERQRAKALLAGRIEAGDWAAAEAGARALLAAAPADAEVARSLAYALVRQDRSTEAVEALSAFLDAHPDAETRSFLERVRHDRLGEATLDEARIAHFHVRYDGDAHEDVGREVLRVLDRHYATLVRTFDHQPRGPIPVILLSRERYDDATGAPGWSGGQYDSFDGRVRIPIAGLTPSLASELDATLVHELTHAFVAETSRGLAPREIHEGLAQLMEGQRCATLLGEGGLRALANGRIQEPHAFYASALCFVEDLVAQRGQGGINDLLRAMADAGNADEGFRRVYGKDMATLYRDWARNLRQRHGS